MNVAQFHQLVEQTWDEIEEKIDDEGLSVDAEIQGAVCTLTFDDEWKTAEGRSFWQHLEEAFARHGEEVKFTS